MNLLLIDTAGPVVGLAGFEHGHLVHLASARVAAGAEGWLGDELTTALARLGALDRVAVTVGPGTFTGLRVGVAAALGVAVARGVPVAMLSSLALRACRVPDQPRVLALLDARKGRVYAGWFDTRGGAHPRALGPEADTNLDLVLEEPSGIAVGEGASVFADAVRAAGHQVAGEADESPVKSGYLLAAHANAVLAEHVGLRYLREPDAKPRLV